MQNLQTNASLCNVELFEVEELEQRLENKWGPCQEEVIIVQTRDCETKTITRCV